MESVAPPPKRNYNRYTDHKRYSLLFQTAEQQMLHRIEGGGLPAMCIRRCHAHQVHRKDLEQTQNLHILAFSLLA